MNYLHTIDLFPDIVSFNYNDHKVYRTKLGGLLTICFLMLFLILSSITISDFLNSLSKPMVFNQILKGQETIQFGSESEFTLKLIFEFYKNGSKRMIKKSDFNINFDYKIDNKSYIDLITYDVTNETKNFEISYDMKFKENATFLDQNDRIIISINFNYPLDKTDYIISTVNFSELYIDKANMKNPVSYITDYKKFVADADYRNHIYMDIGNTHIETNSGLISTDSVEETYIYVNDLFCFYPRNDGKQIIQIDLKPSKSHISYIRIYKKILDIIPNINSNFTILYSVFRFLSLYIKKKSIDIKLINRMFNFENDNEVKNSSQINQNFDSNSLRLTLKNEKKKEFKTATSIYNLHPENYLENNLNSNANLKIKNIQNSNLKRENYFGALDIMSLISNNICFRIASLKKRKLKKALNLKNKFMNIENYLMKVVEFEFLKQLMLDENQLKIFQLLKAPSISDNLVPGDIGYLIQNYNKYSLTNNFNLDEKNLVKECFTAHSQIYFKDNKSRIDEYLLKNVKNF